MLKRRAVTATSSHEDLFIQRYRWLMDWALRLTEHDRQQAEDLVHDAFVHFIISRPSLERIQQNIDGYLYTMLKNMHLSEVRRTARIRDAVTPIADFSLTDYDSVESGLRVLEEMTSAQVHAQIRDQLRRLCRYACVRKFESGGRLDSFTAELCYRKKSRRAHRVSKSWRPMEKSGHANGRGYFRP